MALPKRYVAIDTETTGLNVWRGHRPFAVSMASPGGGKAYWRVEPGKVHTIRRLVDTLRNPNIDKVFQNAKFDLHMFQACGIEVKGQVWDTMILAHLLDGRQEVNLEALSRKYLPLQEGKVVDEVINWFIERKIPKSKRDFYELPPALLKKRAQGDVHLTLLLFERMFPTVQHYFPYLLKLEHDLIPVVMRMEARGITIDFDEIDKQEEHYDKIVTEVVEFCEEAVGYEGFRLSAPTDVHDLFDRAGLLDRILALPARRGKTKMGAPKCNEVNLLVMRHPYAYMVLAGRAATKLRDNFLVDMRAHATDGVIHPDFNQIGAKTGRFSCSKPNLQNIPVDGDTRSGWTSEEADDSYEMTGLRISPHLHKIFKVRPGYAHIHADKQQGEVRMMAHYTNDPVMMEIFASGISIHDGLCMRLYGEVSKTLKWRTKRLVFGYMYGAGADTIAMRMGATVREAKQVIRRLQGQLPGLVPWRTKLEEMVHRQGYVETVHGRRHYLGHSEAYKTINRMCQGTLADEMKGRMIAVDHYLRDYDIDGRIILNIHDDLCIEIERRAVPEHLGPLYDLMQDSDAPYNVRMVSALELTTTDWGDAKEVEDPYNVKRIKQLVSGNSKPPHTRRR